MSHVQKRMMREGEKEQSEVQLPEMQLLSLHFPPTDLN